MSLKKTARDAYNIFWESFLKKGYLNRLDNRIDSVIEGDSCTYYVISCADSTLGSVGLFGYIGLFLQMINYAINHNMIPVIDMKNHLNSIIEKDDIGKINVWDHYFKPIQAMSLEEVYSSGRYVMGNHMETDWNSRPSIQGYHRRDCYWHWAHLYDRYLQFSDETKRYCDAELEKCFKGYNTRDILGVVARGTDLLTARGHAIQPSVDQLMNKLKKVVATKGFKAIYFATESKEIEDVARSVFGDMVITNKRTYYDNTDYSRGLYDVVIKGKTKYERNMEYLSSIYLVSRCGGLVAGNCGGSLGAYYLNHGKYRYVFFFELGTVE